MGKGTIFGLDKRLRVADGPMVGLGASIASDKKARPNTNCLPDRKRGLFFKPKKKSRDA